MTDILIAPNAPRIAGLTFRRFRGPEDFPGMVEVNRAARDAYDIEDPVSLEGIANQYAHLSNSDPATDMLIVELDRRIVGYGRVEWLDQTDGSRGYDTVGLLLPDLRGQGIGGAMLGWLEARAIAVAAEHPTDRPKVLQAEVWDADAYARSLFTARGYEAVRRYYEMVRPTMEAIPDLPLPAGVDIRPVEREHLRAIYDADHEAFLDHFGGIDDTEAGWLRFRNDPLVDPSLYAVAFDGDEVAGLALGQIDPEDAARRRVVRGLIDSVAVRRPWRRRGLARALVAEALRRLRDRGATSAFLGVDADNPNRALDLYTDLGFAVASSATVYRKPLAAGR